MATEMKRIPCISGQYTQLSTGQANVSFRTRHGGRISCASTQPTPSATDYNDLDPDEEVELGSLGAADCIWFMPADVAETIQVTRG